MQLKAPLSSTCQACLERLIDLTVTLATTDGELRERARRQALLIVEKLKNGPGITPAYIASRFHPIIKAICRNEDPFRERKIEEIRTAETIAARALKAMGNRLENAPEKETFSSLLTFSLIGNGLDFFRNPEELENLVTAGPNISINEGDVIYSRLSNPGATVLFLGDNAGEVFFDLPFLKFLGEIGHKVFFAVKGAPVQNDLCWQDLENISVDWGNVVVVSTGCGTVGLELEHASGYFRELYDGADVIMGKGMGHYETLGDTRDERVFLLFQAKCLPVATSSGVTLNSFVIMQPACRRT
ncbi:damage-control phosphatase ARMT1 family protein [Thermodesulforhabdus norvegica]|uniref:Damage-control phosphatase ARMT1-like metal-binding domain-containing protein n=1 Tax=Thermodesulforhabdus norvegica TaxID=39841 RepID=A0A1I4TX23_9BACT|nr:ARMT1-like domain-containing protein [Thermodesulforhabdus norvegica]SFM81356.1 hypothetical protein SAMN05660836_01576 [Thermodesulforhabdus norvegica]